MLNIDDFIKRLEILLDYYNLSASVFADKLGVQRSGLSHLLSGRNKPSLDFVLKITESFPEVDLYWLLDGTGNFPKKENDVADFTQPAVQPPIVTESPAPAPTPPPAPAAAEQPKQDMQQSMPDLFSVAENVPQQTIYEEKNVPDGGRKISINNADEIERIVVFYKNGVFKNYNPG